MNNKDEQQDNYFPNKFINATIRMLSVSSRLAHFMSVILKKSNLTLPQFNALCILAAHHPEPVVLKRLTEQMIDRSSNTSRLVDKLAKKKLVNKRDAVHDRRIIHISMSDDGLLMVNQVSELLASNFEKRISSSEQDEMRQLITDLNILREGA